MTHFVEKGAVMPRSWDAQDCGPTRKKPGEPRDWEKKIFTTAITTYVFKLGRLTIHPATMLGASGLLPERPGGWTSDDTKGSFTPAESASVGAGRPGDAKLSEWTGERTESERRRGLEYARHFAAMDDLHGWFDGGEDGALGRFFLG
ncbi:hypothetical protein F4820DRAFT_464579 [Hypoxylon rubiginosum]|uniref:Uncharacterized protein n=1 Tax=Hypoxylon rubiginosum TaxID=110542 RepID=A0ACB9YQT5_9PEZI|nr:hypothetical protein F4820DRAFT_464579 [Hypoxylon rubiginosum]